MSTQRELLRSPTPTTDLGVRSRQIVGEKLGRTVTNSSPSPNHYLGMYRWDSMLAAKFFGLENNPDLAAEEIETMLSHMRPDGMIPNLVVPEKKRHLIDPELKYYRYPKRYSSYGQPPLEAMACQETYMAYARQGQEVRGKEFLERNYKDLKKSLDYFDKHRRVSSDNPLVRIIHPHETGRDSDPTFDFAKKWLRKTPAIGGIAFGAVRTMANWHDALEFTRSQKRNNWNLARMLESFSFQDVMYNCMYADNLRILSQIAEVLGHEEDQAKYSQLAADVETAVLTKMWDQDARDGKGAFYGIKQDGQQEKVLSISNLFPICLTNISIEQLESIVNQMKDDFSTRYPFPSVGKHEPQYDPDNHLKHTIWRGGVWDNMNWYLVERGIRMQMKRPEVQAETELYTALSQIGDYVSFRSRRRADKHGHPEFSHPEKGHGQRLARDADFLWGTAAYHMPVYSDVELVDVPQEPFKVWTHNTPKQQPRTDAELLKAVSAEEATIRRVKEGSRTKPN